MPLASDLIGSDHFILVLESYLAYTIPVPADSNLDLISNKYILPSGKKLGVLASASGKLDLIISYVEV